MKQPSGALPLAALLALALLSIVLSYCCPAGAHPGDDPLSVWYRSLRSPEGGSCCNDTDCRPVEARLHRGHWEVFDERGDIARDENNMPLSGVWVTVPDERVLKRENADGRPIACFYAGLILCFVPPAGA